MKILIFALIPFMVSCSVLASEKNAKPLDIYKLDLVLNKLTGSVSFLTNDLFLGKRSLERNKKTYQNSLNAIKKFNYAIENLSKESQDLYKAIIDYSNFIEKEFDEYIKNLDVNWSEKDYLAYAEKFWKTKSTVFDKMDSIDKKYRPIYEKAKKADFSNFYH